MASADVTLTVDLKVRKVIETPAAPCPECKGKGFVLLLTGSSPCSLCAGTRDSKVSNRDLAAHSKPIAPGEHFCFEQTNQLPVFPPLIEALKWLNDAMDAGHGLPVGMADHQILDLVTRELEILHERPARSFNCHVISGHGVKWEIPGTGDIQKSYCFPFDTVPPTGAFISSELFVYATRFARARAHLLSPLHDPMAQAMAAREKMMRPAAEVTDNEMIAFVEESLRLLHSTHRADFEIRAWNSHNCRWLSWRVPGTGHPGQSFSIRFELGVVPIAEVLEEHLFYYAKKFAPDRLRFLRGGPHHHDVPSINADSIHPL